MSLFPVTSKALCQNTKSDHTQKDTPSCRYLTHRIFTTTPNQYDRLVDLSKAGEIIHRERGYMGVPYKGFSSTMKRNPWVYLIGILDNIQNIRRKKCPLQGGRTPSVFNNVFPQGLMLV